MSESAGVVMARLEERIENLIDKISNSEIENLIDKISNSESDHKAELVELSKKISMMEDRLKKIEEMAIRYKGGFITVLSLGGVIGWFSSNMDFIRNIGNWLRGS